MYNNATYWLSERMKIIVPEKLRVPHPVFSTFALKSYCADR